MTKSIRSNLNNFFQEIEEKAQERSVRIRRLTRRHNRTCGLILLDNTLPATELKSMLDSLSHTDWTGTKRNNFSSSSAEHREALLDPTTDLPTKNSFMTLLETEIERVERTRLPCSMLFIEIDDFERITKKMADKAKQEMLHNIAGRIGGCLHKIDTLARYDTKVFTVLLPGTNLGRAVQRAEAIRKNVKDETLHGKEGPVPLTVSIGIGIGHTTTVRLDASHFIARTEKELARAKKQGKDRVCHQSQIRNPQTCQVTAEERVQLFNLIL